MVCKKHAKTKPMIFNFKVKNEIISIEAPDVATAYRLLLEKYDIGDIENCDHDHNN